MTELINGPASGSCLLVVLGSRLALAKSPVWPLTSFKLDQKPFHVARYGEWTGFYDWLRDSNRKLLGVRYWPFGDTEFLLEESAKLSYARVEPERLVEFYFSPSRQVEQRLSCDQDFLYDAVFKSDDGDWVITFGMENLQEPDLSSIENADAEWKILSGLRR